MKVSINWLKELVNLNISKEELVKLLPLRSIGIKEVTDSYIELDMKGYNRADLLSLRGVAEEVAAISGSKTQFKDLKEAEFVWSKVKLPSTPVNIEEASLSEVQCVAKIEGLTFGQSPKEWAKKLEDSGMRSVNNIADVTNLIMLEYGQPLHAFDAPTVEDETINVRRAKNREELVTLDGKRRLLDTSDVVLADTQKALDVAGVMGGKDTEVKESTTSILLSASLFNAQMVMKTANRLGLHSEASKRFQHGLTKKRLLQALDAAIRMYEELGGKLVAINLVGNFEDKDRKITLTKKKLEDLVGVKFEDSQVVEYLQKLGFTLATKGQALRAWEVTVPYFRLDIELEEDVIEEVARMYGYEKIPAEKVSESKPVQKGDAIFKTIWDLKQKLVKLGLTEVQTYSFYTISVITALGWEKEKDKLVKVANPISAETEYLRQSIWPNLVETVGKNLRMGFKEIAIFEIGKAFNVGPDGNPTENYRLAIALMNDTDNPLTELYQMAQDLESHLGRGLIAQGGVTLKQIQPPPIAAPLVHPNRFLAFEKEGKEVGGLAEVHLRVLNKLGIEKRVAILEIEIS